MPRAAYANQRVARRGNGLRRPSAIPSMTRPAARTRATRKHSRGGIADAWSVRGVLRLGCVLLAVACAGLGSTSAWAVALANAVRGLGWSGLNTGGNTLLAHLAPSRRRAESASYLSLFQNAPYSL